MGSPELGAPARRVHSVIVEAEDRFAKLPELDKEEGMSFGWFDRMFLGHRDGAVFAYDDWQARDLVDMLKRDYKARQVEAVLTYPTIAAERTFTAAKGDRGELEFAQNYWAADPLNGGCETSLDTIIDQNTSAAVYRKSFHEIRWTVGSGDFEGKVVPADVSWRPQTTCRLMREPRHGKIIGFEQEPWNIGPNIRPNVYPILIPRNRAYVHIHGARRDPINGVSDLEITHWAFKTKQKVLLLWFQFLEGVSLPRVMVKAQDVAVARKVARSMASARGSGIIPVGTDGRPDSVMADVLDLSGKGAEQFLEAIKWLDGCATNSVLAAFLDLPSAAASGRGSHALSSDASDFFLMTLESKNREIEASFRRELLAPMIRYNFGPDARVPYFKFESLTAEDRQTAVSLLDTVLASYAQQPQLIPDDFVMPLAAKVGDFVGIGGDKIAEAFRGVSDRAAKIAAQSSPAGASPAGQAAARAAGATNAATRAVAAAKAGRDPLKAAKAVPDTSRRATAAQKASAKRAAS